MNLKLKWTLKYLNSFVLLYAFAIQACSQSIPIESMFNKVKLVDLLCEKCVISETSDFSFFECRDESNKITFLSSIMGGFEYITRVIVEPSKDSLDVCKESFHFSNGLRIGMSKKDVLSLPLNFYAKENEKLVYEEERNEISELNDKKISFTRSVIIEITLTDDVVMNIDYSVIESDPIVFEK